MFIKHSQSFLLSSSLQLLKSGQRGENHDDHNNNNNNLFIYTYVLFPRHCRDCGPLTPERRCYLTRVQRTRVMYSRIRFRRTKIQSKRCQPIGPACIAAHGISRRKAYTISGGLRGFISKTSIRSKNIFIVKGIIKGR